VVYTLVENVRSLFNVGSIFRSADGAGISKLFLTGITAQPPHREIRKTALGAEEHVPWEYHADALQLVQRLRQEGVAIVVLEAGETSVAFDTAEYPFPLCLVVGNEFHGVSRPLIEAADLTVAIPMRGVKESLNVGVAFGIAAYEIMKQNPRTRSQ